MIKFITRCFNISVTLPRKKTLLGLFIGISIALPVFILFLVTAPHDTNAQSTNPWNLYNNPTYGNALDFSLGPATVDPPPLRLHSNGNMMVRSNIILGQTQAINSQTWASTAKGLIFNSATTPWWVRGNASDTQLAFGTSTDTADASINFSISSTGGISLPKTGAVMSFPAFSGNFTQSQGITAGPNGNMIDGVPWYMSFSREPGNWPNVDGTYPNLVINNHTGVRLTAHGGFAKGGISFYEQLGPDFNWATATSKGTEIARFRLNNYGGSYVSSNLGIGTTAPTDMLQLYKTAGNRVSMNFLQPGVGEGTIGIKASDSNFYLTNTYGLSPTGLGTASMSIAISNVGNVGIGTTAPTQKLDVNGSVKATRLEAPGAVIDIGLNYCSGPCASYHPQAYNAWFNVSAVGYTWATHQNTATEVFSHNGAGTITVLKTGLYKVRMHSMAIPNSDIHNVVVVITCINGGASSWGNSGNTWYKHGYHKAGWWAQETTEMTVNLNANTTIQYCYLYNDPAGLAYWAHDGYTAMQVTRIN